jgi:hypothetical protein
MNDIAVNKIYERLQEKNKNISDMIKKSDINAILYELFNTVCRR